MYRVRVLKGGWLGRHTLGAPLTVVPEAHAYEFDTYEQAVRLADNHFTRTGETTVVEGGGVMDEVHLTLTFEEYERVVQLVEDHLEDVANAGNSTEKDLAEAISLKVSVLQAVGA
jgi:hypothetical protein